MYQVSVELDFDAAHYLRGYRGKCEALHGHRFRVAATVEALALDEIGLAYDFTRLKQHLGEIVDRFDHTCLNDAPPFDKINPSSENIAATIHRELSARIGKDPVKLTTIEVWESPQSRITYRPD
ncbi:MAG: 6-carboxytetrahydropterin synthase QueD [Chloroflexota bacterium]